MDTLKYFNQCWCVDSLQSRKVISIYPVPERLQTAITLIRETKVDESMKQSNTIVGLQFVVCSVDGLDIGRSPLPDYPSRRLWGRNGAALK